MLSLLIEFTLFQKFRRIKRFGDIQLQTNLTVNWCFLLLLSIVLLLLLSLSLFATVSYSVLLICCSVIRLLSRRCAMLLAYAAVAQLLHRGIRCCVEGGETTFELVSTTWSGWLHRRVGCRCNPTDGDWLHIGQCLIGNGSEVRTHHSRLGRLAPGTGTVGSSLISELAGSAQ